MASGVEGLRGSRGGSSFQLVDSSTRLGPTPPHPLPCGRALAVPSSERPVDPPA